MNQTQSTAISGFTFPVTDGIDVYTIDNLRSLVDDHADGITDYEGDDREGWTVSVRQQGNDVTIGSGDTLEEAIADAAQRILNGDNGPGLANGEPWDDLHSATEMLNDADDEGDRDIWSARVDMLLAAGAK